MTREEIVKRRDGAVAQIRESLQVIEQLKAQVAANRGAISVYDSILEEMDKADSPEKKGAKK